MQTKRRTSQPSGADSFTRTVPLGHFARCKPSKANRTVGGNANPHFLNKVFRPIRQIRLDPFFTPQSFDYLYQSARNYANSQGRSFDFRCRKNDFGGLFNYLETVIPKNHSLLLVVQNEKLSFKIAYGDDFLVREIIFIPIRLLNKIEGQFRDILLSFFQHFQQTHDFPKKENLYDYDAVMNCYFDEWTEVERDLEDAEEQEVMDYLTAYKEGYIHDTFSLIHQKPMLSLDELKRRITDYSPRNDNEKNLLKTLLEGIELMKTGKNIFDYRHRPEENDDNFYGVDDDYMIEIERLIRFVYSSNDCVTESYVDYLNSDCETLINEYFPCQSLLLSPDENYLYGDGFVELFFNWIHQFINHLYEYESN